MSFNYRSWSSYHKGHENNLSRDQVFHEKSKESAFQRTKLIAFYHIKSAKPTGNSKKSPALGCSAEEGVAHWGLQRGSRPCPAANTSSLPCPRATAQASLAPTAPWAAPQPGNPSPGAATGPCRVLSLLTWNNLHLYISLIANFPLERDKELLFR